MALLRCCIMILGCALGCQRLPSLGPFTPSPDPYAGPTVGPNVGQAATPNYLTTYNGHLRSQNANLALHGIGWWGFETQINMLAGWDQPSNLVADVATVVLRMRLLGFNAVRLPMTFAHLLDTDTPAPVATPCSNDSSGPLFAQSVLDTNRTPADGWTLHVAPQGRDPNLCNDYFPTDSTLSRYVWMVQFLAANDFFVLIDDHVNQDSEQVGDDDWADHWTRLAKALLQPVPPTGAYVPLLPPACASATTCAALPAGCINPVCEHVMFDFISTAHDSNNVSSLPWNANAPTDAHHAYLAAMDAVWPIIPHALFFIEGAAQPTLSYSFGTGVSLDTSLTGSAAYDPRPLFNDLVNRPYVDQVVLAPSVFGPSLMLGSLQAYSSDDFTRQLHVQFDLWRAGYPTPTGRHVFPFVPVAFGANFDGNSTADEQAMNVFANFVNTYGVDAWFYWAWPSVGTPLGLQLQPSGWAIDRDKMSFLKTLNLQQP